MINFNSTFHEPVDGPSVCLKGGNVLVNLSLVTDAAYSHKTTAEICADYKILLQKLRKPDELYLSIFYTGPFNAMNFTIRGFFKA